MSRPGIRSRIRFNFINVLLGTLFALLSAVMLPAAHAEIFKCTDEYGNAAYLQTPCPVEEVKAAVSEEPEPDSVEVAQVEEESQVLPEPQALPEPQPQAEPLPSSRQGDELQSSCKKRYRDQIDEIDAEIRTAFSPAQGDEYKARLKVLTRQLRACG